MVRGFGSNTPVVHNKRGELEKVEEPHFEADAKKWKEIGKELVKGIELRY